MMSNSDQICKESEITPSDGEADTVESSASERTSGSEYVDSDEEYVPSEEEYVPSEEEYVPSKEHNVTDGTIPSTSRSRVTKTVSKIKKSADDGCLDRFNARIQEWKKNKKRSQKKLPDQESGNSTELENITVDDDFHEIAGLKVPNSIWKKLFRYQKTGVKWLWELHQIESGGLLGDEMGLGKTIQIIAFMAGLSISRSGSWGGLGPSLIVAPATVLHQWVQHFHHWWPPFRVAVLHNSGSHQGAPDRLIRDIHNNHGILIITYTGVVKHKDALESRKWHYVILDEGHKIKNSDTQISKAVKKLQTPHRLVVTGSPMQNNLQELWSLFDFMSPGLLGTLHAFIEHFANPITQGGYTNASKWQETTALSLAITLKDVITPYMLRRTKAQVRDHLKLPEKKEQVLFCSLSDEQKDIYKSYLLSSTVRSILDKESRYGDPFRARILVGLCILRKICNHPDLYTCEIDEELLDDSSLPSDKCFGYWRKAGKMVVINSLLKIWKKQGHRVLIFTQSRAMLCILELFLQQNNHKYLKMDGTTNIGTRQPLINLFNSDDSYLVFLATTRVGGLGVNLTGADRVVIYDPDWNPAIDSQAKERAWRIGQNRDVTIYRLLSAGTVEEKIYQRQVFKQLIGNKVLLDPNQKNYLKTSTLQGLFSLEEPDKTGSTETSNIFKHTQVKPKPPKENNDEVILNGGVSFSKSKMDAMRRLAQRISKNISATVTDKKDVEIAEDPRERYKKKRQPPPPPPPEEPPVNKIDDQVTNADFSSVLSEIDIVNMYAKPDHLEFLKLNKNAEEIEVEDGEIVEENIGLEKNDDCENNCEKEYIKIEEVNNPNGSVILKKEKKNKKHHSSVKPMADDISIIKGEKRKRKEKKLVSLLSEDGLNDEELLQSIKKIKKKKQKPETEKSEEDPDQYVLEKLFAKSGVQSALQHDKVVGLAEREERHRMHTEAQQVALRALKTLRKSRIKNWRW